MDNEAAKSSIPSTDSHEMECELTLLMPCLNEADTLGTCIDKALSFLRKHNVAGEVLIADNGSTDNSHEIAARHGARVVKITQKGYGSALLGGIAMAKGRYIIMGDADDSYDFTNLMPFLQELRNGRQLVMGNRFRGGIKPGAMPSLHRYLGNPVLTGIGRLFFKSTVGDFHCGLRGFDRESIDQLDLQSSGMELASEMVVKATLNGLRITEVPTTLSPDGRNRPPHLRSWRDGWRHLRFLLMYSPRWLFLYPGLFLFFTGLAILFWLLPGPRQLGSINLDIHTMLFGSATTILGVQSLSFALFAKLYGINAGFLPSSDWLVKLLTEFRLERALILGMALFVAGLGGSGCAFYFWGAGAFGELIPSSMMRLIIPSVTAMVIGTQIGLSAFMLSVLKIPVRQRLTRQNLSNRDYPPESIKPVDH